MSNVHGSKWIRPEKRLAIYARDGFACIYCGAEGSHEAGALTLDHVVARELGGGNEASNLVTACAACNSSRQDRGNRAFFADLRDRGCDTSKLSARISRQVRKALDMRLGRELLRSRSAKIAD